MYLFLALSSGVLWGVWGFGYGRYGRVMSRYSVLLFSASGAALTFLVAGLVRHDMRIDSIDVRDGLLGGFLNLLGSVLLLKALTMGNWSRLSSFLNQPGRHCAPRVSVSERENDQNRDRCSWRRSHRRGSGLHLTTSV